MTDSSDNTPLLHDSDDARLFSRLVQPVRDYALFLLTASGHVATWNSGAALIKGYRAEEIIGRHFSIFYPPAALERNWPQTELEIATREGRLEDEDWRLRKDGSRFWASVAITALRGDHGELRGFAKITRDLTQRRIEEQRLRESEERFRLLVQSAGDHAIFMLDPTGRIASWNVGAERMKGYTAAEIIGRHFSIFYPPEANARDWPEHELRAAREYGHFEDEGWRVRKDGTQFWANVSLTAIEGPDGQLRGFAKITRDMSERDRVRALERSEKHTSEFLAMLGHELRNPLSAVRNASYIVQQLGDTPALAKAGEILNRQLEHFTRIVDDLLDVSRIRSGKIELRKIALQLDEVLRRAVESVEPLLREREHTLVLPPADPGMMVDGDMARLVQLFTNIFNNAAKYTPPGGTIQVSVLGRDDHVLVCVSDNGVGIPEQLLSHIFELFTQGERKLDRSEGGLGIGLSLARRIAELHGGSIEARSEGIGKGSDFLIRLPLRVQALQEQPMGLQTEASSSVPNHILVVDDLRDCADSLAMHLKLQGYAVDACYSGEDALPLFDESHHDVVLLDIGLPGLNGYEICKHVRSRKSEQRPLVIAITGYGQQHDRERSLEAGFDYHLVKPIDLQVLLATIRSRLAAAESR